LKRVRTAVKNLCSCFYADNTAGKFADLQCWFTVKPEKNKEKKENV